MSFAVVGGSTLWFLSRATGIVAFILLTVTVVLGIMTSLRWQSRSIPRFVVEYVHRNVTVLVLALIVIHVATVVVDGFAPIGWIAAVIPFTSSYRPIWLSLGALGFDLLLAVAVTSWLRHRVGFRIWRFLHWSAYASWLVVLIHAFGTGTDTREGWALLIEGGCAAAVVVAVWLRVGAEWEQHTRVQRRRARRDDPGPAHRRRMAARRAPRPELGGARRNPEDRPGALVEPREQPMTRVVTPLSDPPFTPGPASLPRSAHRAPTRSRAVARRAPRAPRSAPSDGRCAGSST